MISSFYEMIFGVQVIFLFPIIVHALHLNLQRRRLQLDEIKKQVEKLGSRQDPNYKLYN